MEQEYGRNFFDLDTASLAAIIDRYPWFTAARIRRMGFSGIADDALSLALLTKPWPACLVEPGKSPTLPVTVQPVESSAASPADDIIERFLTTGDKKIVPDENTPTEDVSEESSTFVPDEDMDTEELARIYRQQGLDRMADEVTEIVGESMEEEI